MDKFKGKYRIQSARLQNWNYGAMGAYFVTICTKNREHFFGEIIDREMCLTEIGKKAEGEWLRTLELRQDMKLELGNFIVMPNHFHGILIIGNNEFNSQPNSCRDAMHGDSTKPDAICGLSTEIDAMHGVSTETNKNKFGPQCKNLASIMRGFKSSVTTYAKINTAIDFGWQTRFHDHIIRNSEEFERIQNYIANNVENWKEDRFYINGIDPM